ncbi:MAG: hypothetical protein CBC24_06015 [Candidatus Pelagibacter sp. TMED64]|nr:KpsF/GutQ family sugar-phosphate isomerase [Candidatus Pelagibacter sp.]OUU64987.1 MAG: hypothetical protein CBC24_06015 [Candidatus Pelagibacter sp. TMED64]|tara:strand:+ start:1118 stop:2104 length:987 start_codon:yes stop_codon:yes gene_type:complete
MKQKNYIKIAKDVIAEEILALKKLNSSFDKSFLKAIELIGQCKGKVILAGIGKSGLISRKISATLSSVSIPSFYLHPSEASHGDLGQITKQDILIILSYSGETEELKHIINYANRFSIKIVGVASKENSLLLKSSNIKIILPKVKEAGIANLAPTSSTTTMIAFGDALAVALMHKTKFTKDKFKIFHPSGSLAKILITAKDLMIKGTNLPIVSQNLKMDEAINVMSKKKLGCLVVKDNKKKVVGLITDGDLRRKNKNNLLQKKVKDIMTINPKYINESMLAVKALDIMNKKKITSLLVSSDKDHKNKNKKFKIKGLLHIHALLQQGIK